MTKYNCLLINPIIKPNDPQYNIPLGLIQIAAVIDKKGHNVALYDNNAYRMEDIDIIKEIASNSWDIIGVGNLITTYSRQKSLFKLLRKEFPNTLLISGGGLSTCVKGELTKLIPEIDLICVGEGEKTISQIIDNFDTKSWENVNGIYYKDKFNPPVIMTEEELNELPFPKYDLLPLDIYFKYSGIPLSPEAMACNRRISIEASRGCVFNCSFCTDLYAGTPRNGCNTKIRYFNPQRTINLIKELRLKYSIDFVSFMDENFTINKKYVLEFCDLFEKELMNLDPPILWGTTAHVNTIDNSLLKRMKSVGCSYLDLGLESMNDTILKEDINKGSTVKDNIRGFNQCISNNIYPITNFIIGFPGESTQSVYDTTKFLKKNNIQCGPFFATPYLNTGLFEKYKDKIIEIFGTLENFLIKCEEDVANDFVVNLTKYNDAELLGLRDMIINHDLEQIKQFSIQKKEVIDEYTSNCSTW